MEQYRSAGPDANDADPRDNLGEDAAVRAEQRRRSSGNFISILGSLIGAAGAVVGAITSISSSLITVHGLYFAIGAIGVVVVAGIAILAFWILTGRPAHTKPYASESDIRDDNLRMLIAEITAGQIEFERRMTLANRPALPAP